MSNQDKKEELALQADLTDLKKVLATPEGKRVAWRILEFCGVYRNPFTGNRDQTDYNCGLQAVGQWFLDEALAANTEAVSEIIINNNKREK